MGLYEAAIAFLKDQSGRGTDADTAGLNDIQVSMVHEYAEAEDITWAEARERLHLPPPPAQGS
jgi:hypothetical protein